VVTFAIPQVLELVFHNICTKTMQRFTSLILPAITAVLLTACSTSEEYEPPVYTCDCGTLVLDGDSLEVLGAEFVYLQQEDSLFSRRYFVTADAQTADESEEHGVSLILDVPNVQQGAVFYPADGAFTQIDETNFNVAFDTTQTFRITNGVASIMAAPLTGGEETVTLDFLIRREQNGELVGFERTLKGNFKLEIN
jgi:hypothetical protein